MTDARLSKSSASIPLPQRSSTVPLVLSAVLHGVLLGTLWWSWPSSRQGTVKAPVRSVGLAIAHRLPDRTRYAVDAIKRDAVVEKESTQRTERADSAAPSRGRADSDSASDANETSPAEAGSSGGQPPADFVAPFDLDSVLAEMTGQGSGGLGESAGESAGEGDGRGVASGVARFAGGLSAEQLEDRELVPGGPRSGGGAGRTTATLFGVSGSGSTFVYVFDRSESMTGAALRRAKAELIESLKTLTERQQFQIIFYNHRPRPFAPDRSPVGLVLGEASVIERASRYVDSIIAVGGTEHEAALKMALRLAPDVVFFLTDAKIQTISDAQIDEITRRAEYAGTVLHAIQFGSGPAPANSFVQTLARRNRGGYQYLDVTGFEP